MKLVTQPPVFLVGNNWTFKHRFFTVQTLSLSTFSIWASLPILEANLVLNIRQWWNTKSYYFRTEGIDLTIKFFHHYVLNKFFGRYVIFRLKSVGNTINIFVTANQSESELVFPSFINGVAYGNTYWSLEKKTKQWSSRDCSQNLIKLPDLTIYIQSSTIEITVTGVNGLSLVTKIAVVDLNTWKYLVTTLVDKL